jgi:hypothetical protein
VLLPPPLRAEWRVQAYLGGAKTLDSTLHLEQPAAGHDLELDPVAFGSESFELPLYYGIRAGGFLPHVPWLGFEVEFTHLKVIADTRRGARATGRVSGAAVDREATLGEFLQEFEISHGMNFLFVNAVVRWPEAAARRVHLLLRAAGGPTLPHGESSTGGQRLEQYELSGPGVQVAAGVEVTVRGGLHGLIEYKLARAHPTVTVIDGSADAVFWTHHGVFGLGYTF